MSTIAAHHKTVFTELGNYLTAFRLCNSRGRKIGWGKGEKRKEKKRQAKRSGEKTSTRTWTMRNSEQLDFYLRGGIDKRPERINSGAASSDDFKARGKTKAHGGWKLGAFPALTQPFALSLSLPSPLRLAFDLSVDIN